MRFDHVALAAHDLLPALDVLVGDLGGVLLQGAESRGFRSVQVRMGDADHGMTVELIEPWRTSEFDFLERFLRAHGDGPHHLTFKVDDLVAERDRLLARGYDPVGFVDTPRWKETFLTPAEAHGTVAQLAEGGMVFRSFAALFENACAAGPYGEPRWWPDPPPRATDRAVLERVVVQTPGIDGAIALYGDTLGGTVVEHHDTAAELTWEGGGRVRFEVGDPPAAGIVRLELAGHGPARALTVAGTQLLIGSA